jgi:hypothetical protein
MSTTVVKAVLVAAAVTPIADCGIEQKNLSIEDQAAAYCSGHH